MPIATDLKSYADKAQAQLNDVTGQANELYGKARTNVGEIADKAVEAANELRASAEKAVNLDSFKSAVEPYVTQVRDYTSGVTERAESLLAEARKDKRVQQLIEAVEDVFEQVEQRVVKPVLSLAGRSSAPATSTRPAATASAPRTVAAKKPAAKPAPVKAAAAKATATKATAKKTVRKVTAKRTAKA